MVFLIRFCAWWSHHTNKRRPNGQCMLSSVSSLRPSSWDSYKERHVPSTCQVEPHCKRTRWHLQLWGRTARCQCSLTRNPKLKARSTQVQKAHANDANAQLCRYTKVPYQGPKNHWNVLPRCSVEHQLVSCHTQ